MVLNIETLENLVMFPATIENSQRGRCLPLTTEEDIRDRSKSDSFTKVFACLQCGWLIMQSIARVSTGLPLAELELMTLTFIVTAIVMYGFWWDKPFDVERITVLICPKNKAKDVLLGLDVKKKIMRQRNLTEIYFEYYFSPDSKLTAVTYLTVCGLFLGVHTIAWDWDFPSQVVQSIWRGCSILAIISSLMSFTMLYPIYFQIEDDTFESRFVVAFSTLAFFSFPIAYTISRLGLTAIAFYSFSSMPTAVYETVNWVGIFPRFS
jgi:hypothetical protein